MDDFQTTAQLHGWRDRLQHELARALGQHPIRGDLVERLVHDLAHIDSRLARELAGHCG